MSVLASVVFLIELGKWPSVLEEMFIGVIARIFREVLSNYIFLRHESCNKEQSIAN